MVKRYSSKYNYVNQINGEVIIYNSKTGQIISLENEKVTVDDFKAGKRIENKIDAHIEKYLFDNGFIVYDLENEMKEVISQYQQVVEKKELFLEILPTEQCNFRCIYCYEKFERNFMDKGNINNLIEFVRRQIRGCSALRIVWFGGEPLIAIDIIQEVTEKFLKICSKERIPYFASISTNGYLLTPDIWKKLKKCHICNFQITVDGLENVHDKQRVLLNGKSTWKNIINNLCYIRDETKTNMINIMIRTNITKEIYNQRDEYIEFLANQFGNDCRFSFFFHLVEDWGYIGQEVKDKFCTVENFFEVLELAAAKKLPLDVFRFFLLPESRVCFAGREKAFVITSDGKIRKCSQRLYDEKNYIGNLDNNTGENINIKENPYKKELMKECKECPKLPLCFGLVCPAYSGNVTDTCGYDLSDINRLIKILYQTNHEVIIKIEDKVGE